MPAVMHAIAIVSANIFRSKRELDSLKVLIACTIFIATSRWRRLEKSVLIVGESGSRSIISCNVSGCGSRRRPESVIEVSAKLYVSRTLPKGKMKTTNGAEETFLWDTVSRWGL